MFHLRRAHGYTCRAQVKLQLMIGTLQLTIGAYISNCASCASTGGQALIIVHHPTFLRAHTSTFHKVHHLASSMASSAELAADTPASSRPPELQNIRKATVTYSPESVGKFSTRKRRASLKKLPPICQFIWFSRHDKLWAFALPRQRDSGVGMALERDS